MEKSVACTLTPDDAAARVDEWRTLLGRSAAEGVRSDDRSLRIRLRSSPDDLVGAVDLAGRETACCGFFDFSIEIRSDSNWLIVRVPPEAVAVLDDFAALVPVGNGATG